VDALTWKIDMVDFMPSMKMDISTIGFTIEFLAIAVIIIVRMWGVTHLILETIGVLPDA
jgi:hypothetical protein